MPIKKKTKKPIDLKDKLRRGGFYFVKDKEGIEKPYPSVTKIISVLDKPMLQRWYGSEVYKAVIVDPSISESDALSAPWRSSGIAKTRGTFVHKITENFKDTPEYMDSLPEDKKGYAIAYKNWTHDYNPTIICQEKTVVSKEYGFAGTLDIMARLNDSSKLTIIDKKTGKGIYPECVLQLSAYKQAMKELGKDVDIGALLLMPDGSYQFHRYEVSKLKEFLACKLIYEWQHEDLIKKINDLIIKKQNGQRFANK